MQSRIKFVFLAGLCTAVLAPSAAASCGLDVDAGALDTNRDAQLSRAEVRGTALAPVFDRIDTNRGGTVSQPEYVDRCSSLQAKKKGGWDSSGSA